MSRQITVRPPRFDRVGVERTNAWLWAGLLASLVGLIALGALVFESDVVDMVFVLGGLALYPLAARCLSWLARRSKRAPATAPAELPELADVIPLLSAGWLPAPLRWLGSIAHARIVIAREGTVLASRFGRRALLASELRTARAHPEGIALVDQQGRHFVLATCRPPRELGPSSVWPALAQAELEARFEALCFNEAVLERLRAPSPSAAAYR